MFTQEEIDYYKGVATTLWITYGPIEAHNITDKAIVELSINKEEIPLIRAQLIKTELNNLSEFYKGTNEEVAERIAKGLLTFGTVNETIEMLEGVIAGSDQYMRGEAILTKAALLRITQKAN